MGRKMWSVKYMGALNIGMQSTGAPSVEAQGG